MPAQLSSHIEMPPVVACQCTPSSLREVTAALIAGQETTAGQRDQCRRHMTAGTAAHEKRQLALEIPQWDVDPARTVACPLAMSAPRYAPRCPDED